MARTKQTARRSTGGKAPRKQLATKAARSFRQYMTSQQSVGRRASAGPSSSTKKAEKTSMLNYENVLGNFNFATYESVSDDFVPTFGALAVENPTTGCRETYVGLSINSKYNGDGMKVHGRPDLNLVLTIDISGSMGCGFDDDSWGVNIENSKLEVAKKCVLAIVDQLRNEDRLGIILFNHGTNVFQNLTKIKDLDIEDLKQRLATLRPSGGTNLVNGFDAGMDELGVSDDTDQTSNRFNRMIFLTDMESSQQDEDAVLNSAKLRAEKNAFHTTVVGIGVDLSVATVERISCLPGGKYASVASAEEFTKTIASEFCYDVTPIAFNISVTFETENGKNIKLVKGFGSPELNAMKKNSSKFSLASEFPTTLTSVNGQTLIPGGILLVRLDDRLLTNADQVVAKVKFEDVNGLQYNGKQQVQVQKQSETAFSTSIRKAIALVRFVDLQSEYVLDDGQDTQDKQVAKAAHERYVNTFENFRGWFLNEMNACGDETLQTNNQAISQTIDQIIDLEKKEVANAIQAIKDAALAAKKQKSKGKKKTTASGNTPHEFLCPITSEVMKEPVVASDGHTYEKSALEKWIQGKARPVSPVTGIVLNATNLIPNYALKKMIHDYLDGGVTCKPSITKTRTTATSRRASVNRRSTRQASLKASLAIKYSS